MYAERFDKRLDDRRLERTGERERVRVRDRPRRSDDDDAELASAFAFEDDVEEVEAASSPTLASAVRRTLPTIEIFGFGFSSSSSVISFGGAV